MSELHERTLAIETRPLADERLGVHAELRDVRHVEMPAYLGVSHPAGVVHHMMLDLEIDRELMIVGADARMQTAPFSPSEKTWGEGCRDILPSYRSLVGTKLDADYAGHVFETVGGRLGCFHILSLAQCVPLAVRAASARLCGGALNMPAGSRATVRDSCAEWRAGSPHWAAVRERAGAGSPTPKRPGPRPRQRRTRRRGWIRRSVPGTRRRGSPPPPATSGRGAVRSTDAEPPAPRWHRPPGSPEPRGARPARGRRAGGGARRRLPRDSPPMSPVGRW